MSYTTRFKTLSVVKNSNLTEAQNNVLESYIRILSENDAAKLLALFTNEPKSISLYADFVSEIMHHDHVTNQDIEVIMTKLLEKIA